MRALILTKVILFSVCMVIRAQDFVQISTGPAYALQSYYDLSSDEEVQVDNMAWDLMFTTIGLQDAGIHINEGTISSFTAPAPELELYLAPTDDFDAAIDPAELTERLYNDEESWLFGAFNATRIPGNPLDFGWGVYNPANNTVEGNTVFVIKLRNGEYKKVMIESLSVAYQLRYADLDGSGETTVSINKNDFQAAPFAFFSFDAESTVDVASASWDLLFTRYATPLDDGMGDTLDYIVTGVLSGWGVEVAEITGIDPSDVTVEEVDAYETALDIIGHDWKTFDFNQGWLLPSDLSFIVKTADNHLYKLVFIDFEGSSTGTATFEKTDLGVVSTDDLTAGPVTSCNVYPNPVGPGPVTLAYTSSERIDRLDARLFDARGALVWQSGFPGGDGLQAREMELPAHLNNGKYVLQLTARNQVLASRSILVQK